jgi:hypothetical protein
VVLQTDKDSNCEGMMNVCTIHNRHASILKVVKTMKEAGPDEETPSVQVRHSNSLILPRPEVQDMCSRWSMTS